MMAADCVDCDSCRRRVTLPYPGDRATLRLLLSEGWAHGKLVWGHSVHQVVTLCPACTERDFG